MLSHFEGNNMSVTAARLGKSPLTVNWSGLMLDNASLTPDLFELKEAWKKLTEQFEKNEVGFFFAPTKNELSQLEQSQKAAQEKLNLNTFTDCLILGIGGSALGPLSAIDALEHLRKTSIRFHFAENPDPIDWKLTLKKLNPQNTLVCVVTKSGSTFETVSQFMIALEWLGQARWSSHIIAITDPHKGELKEFSDHYKIPQLFIDPSIGGRFSIFSPVGLFPMALAGLNCSEFLNGAEAIQNYTLKTALEKNILFIIADIFLYYAQSKNTHLCMPYSTRLRKIGLWWVQLWGESLGKDGKGFNPIAAVGATDQHSILQLLRDGPNDKITCFISIGETEDKVKIPPLPEKTNLNLKTFRLLEGKSLFELLKAEHQATQKVLLKNKRPHFNIDMDTLDEKSMGALYFTFSLLTAFTGTLWGVNPFDQPGVEEGKVYTRETLSNPHL